jgi:predicted permease
LIASANVAGMMLARSLSRRRELALRLAIGAQRLRIVRHLSVETLVLFAIGGGLGVALAYGWAAPLESLVRPWSAYEDVAVNAQPQAQALTFALLVTGVTGLVFALIPALQSSKPDLVSSLRGGGRWSVTRAMGRDLFVGSQIAMSALLLLVAGLLVRSLQRSLDVDLGFRHEDVVLATTDLAPHDYDEERGRAYYERLLAESKAIPGVRAAGLSQFVLMSPGRSRGPIVRDDETSDGERRQMTSFNVVTPDYLETVGLELVAGRWFTERDSEGTPPVAVINQTLAARLWPGESPLGASFRRLGGDPYGVVGVVKDGKYQFLAEGETSFVFFPFGQSYRPQMTLHVRAPEQLASVSLAVQDIVRRLDPDIAIEGSRTYAEVLDLATFPYRVAASMTGVFGLIGLALSVIGVYGVLSFQVAQRTREFGVRRALGAPAATLLGGVVRRGVGLAAVGCAFGLLLGGGVGQLLRSFLVDLSPLDPPTFVGIPLLLLLAAALASLVPALRATSVDAMESLREE